MSRWATLAARLVTVASVGVLAIPVVTAAPAHADAPVAAGWWYEANAGLPVAPPPPAGVPGGGLYIENGFGGPAAIAALSFRVPAGAAVGPLVLHLAGSPTITGAPVACPLRSPTFTPAQEGAWSSRPAYDCQRATSDGKVDAAKTTVTFDVSPFVRDGAVAVALLAGGPADQMAFQKPGAGTLAVTPVDQAPVPAAAGPAPAVSPSPATGPAPVVAPPDPGVAGAGPVAAPPLQPTPPVAAPPVVDSSPATAVTPAAASPVAALHRSPWHARVARVLGVLALLVVLVAWTEGFGVLGGRIRPLSAPVPRLPPPPAE